MADMMCDDALNLDEDIKTGMFVFVHILWIFHVTPCNEILRSSFVCNSALVIAIYIWQPEANFWGFVGNLRLSEREEYICVFVCVFYTGEVV